MGTIASAVAARLLSLLERAITLWLAFRAGRLAQQKKAAEQTSEVKDAQAQIAADRPVDRDDLLRRLRERGL